MPSQRLNEYQLLLKDLAKQMARLEEPVDDIEKGIKEIETILAKANEEDSEPMEVEPETDVPVLSSPSLSASNDKLSSKLKNVLRAKEFFDVIESDGKKNERLVFLFKTRMFISEINKNPISESQRTYNIQQIVKLNEAKFAVDSDNPRAIVITSNNLSDRKFPIQMNAKSEEQAREWVQMMNTIPSEPVCMLINNSIRLIFVLGVLQKAMILMKMLMKQVC